MFELLHQLRDNLEEVSYETHIRHLEDRRLWILDNAIAILAPIIQNGMKDALPC